MSGKTLQIQDWEKAQAALIDRLQRLRNAALPVVNSARVSRQFKDRIAKDFESIITELQQIGH